MANINKIKLSGTTYNIQDLNATKTVELTQAEYDALSPKDPNTFYIITDAQGADLSNYYTKSETSGATEISTALASKADTATTYTKTETDNAITAATSTKQDTLVSGTNIKTINNQSILGEGNIEIQGGSGSSYTAGDGIDITNDVISVTGKVDTSAFTAHTADTVIHVTSDEKAAWNAKSDFSGDYNDLANKPTIPTVPTSNTAFTNDAGYITSDAISGKVDTSTYNTYTAATDTALASKQTTLTAGTGISIVDNVISATGGGGSGKAVSAGTNISITTGDTADTINCTLPISAGTGSQSIIAACTASYPNEASESGAIALNGSQFYPTKATGINSLAQGQDTIAQGRSSHAEGNRTRAIGDGSHTEGARTSAMTESSHAEGFCTITTNKFEHSSGQYNNSVSASTNFGDSGNTLFSVGNGTSKSTMHNAFEIRQNGDIYIADTNDTSTSNWYEKPMIKLQDALGGGGGTVDTEITSASTNPVTSAAIYNQFGGLKLVKLTQSEYDSLTTKNSSTLYIING